MQAIPSSVGIDLNRHNSLARILTLRYRLGHRPDRALAQHTGVLDGTCHEHILQLMKSPDILRCFYVRQVAMSMTMVDRAAVIASRVAVLPLPRRRLADGDVAWTPR